MVSPVGVLIWAPVGVGSWAEAALGSLTAPRRSLRCPRFRSKGRSLPRSASSCWRGQPEWEHKAPVVNGA